MRIAALQAHPVWLDPGATTKKIIATVTDAAAHGVELVAFPEAFLPGYPFWVMLGGVDRFNDPRQQQAYAAYLDAAVEPDGAEVQEIAQAARDLGVFVSLGVAERAGTSVYATLLAIDPDHGIVDAHRKLVPTYGERLVWTPGDGHGLHTHRIRGGLRVGGLNCWENWMPQARHALYADGEDLHLAAFPGSAFAVGDLARFIALEGRMWVMAASGLLDADDVPADFPFHDLLTDKPPGFYNGGSCVASPNGTWIVEPTIDEERLVIADIDRTAVLRARQTFDPAGHYARPDVFDVRVDRRRHTASTVEERR